MNPLKPTKPLTHLKLEALTPVDRIFFVACSLFGADAKTALLGRLPVTFPEPTEFSDELLRIFLKKFCDFQKQSYFLGTHPSWMEAQKLPSSNHPAVQALLKKNLLRMSQYDDLLETGQQELAAYFIRIGKQKTAQLLATLPKELQDSLIEALQQAADEFSTSNLDFEFLFNFRYLNAQDLFKQAGLYTKDPSNLQQLAQRLPYAEGQKLLTKK